MLQQIRTTPTGPALTVLESPGGSLEEQYPDELRRWATFLSIPMLAACACVAAAIGTSLHWLYGGAVLFGPGLSVAAIIYLSISTDTNRARPLRAASALHPTPGSEAAAATSRR